MPTLLPMFLTNFIKNIPGKTHYRGIEYRRNYCKLNNGHLDAAIAATPYWKIK
jgi:LysR family hydrogen peroxide-inducible transcriptional activator